MRSRLRLVVVGGCGVLLAGIAAGAITAAGPNDRLPPDKQALEDGAARHRATAPRADKTRLTGGPLVIQTDPPPDTGLLGLVGAPVPGGVFTPTSAWAGWTDPTTYVQVYAGDSPDHPGRGLVLVVRRTGADGRLDPSADPVTTFVTPPAAGGPLRIVRVEGTRLVVANRGGHEFVFVPASAAFE